MQDVAGYFHLLGRTPQNLMERAGVFCHHTAIKLLAGEANVCVLPDAKARFPLQPTSPSSRSHRRKSAWTRGGASCGKSSSGTAPHYAPHPSVACAVSLSMWSTWLHPSDRRAASSARLPLVSCNCSAKQAECGSCCHGSPCRALPAAPARTWRCWAAARTDDNTGLGCQHDQAVSLKGSLLSQVRSDEPGHRQHAGYASHPDHAVSCCAFNFSLADQLRHVALSQHTWDGVTKQFRP